IGRQVAATEPRTDRDVGPFDNSRPFRSWRRQVKTQYVAAAIKVAAVEDQRAVAVIDARPRIGRRYQPPQQRRHPLRGDGKFETKKRVIGRAIAFARLQFQKSLRIDIDGVRLRRLSGDRDGDELALNNQALYPRVDQAGSELGEVNDAQPEGE